MKRKLCIILSVVLLLLLYSCGFVTNKKVSIEETKKHFSRYVDDVKDCIEEHEIKEVNFDYNFYKDGFGTISFYCEYFYLYFDLYNDRENLFGDNSEFGLEKYRISYQREFLDADDILNTQNPSFKVLSVLLSDITEETVTEEEIKTFLSKIKENTKVPNFDNTVKQENLISYKTVLKGQRVDYFLNFRPIRDGVFTEVIIFGDNGTGYTKI